MTHRHRILHLRASRFVGGPERQILRYAEFEQDSGIEIVIGTFLGDGEGTELLEEAHRRGIRTMALEGRLPVRTLARYVRENRIDLICTHGYKPAIAAAIVARMTGVRFAVCLRGFTAEDSKVAFYERLERRIARYADRVVCLSNLQAARTRALGISQRLHIVVNAILPVTTGRDEKERCRKELETRLSMKLDGPVLASAGRLSREKGVQFFVEAMRAIHEAHSDARFIVFGDGVQRRSLEQQARSLRVDSFVRFAGHVRDFTTLLPGIDLLVNPSLTEEMPNVVLEAMANGVPVIATAVGGVPEIAGEPPAMALVPAGDPAAIARTAIDLLFDMKKLSELGRAGRGRIAQCFSPYRQNGQLRTLYSELIPGFCPEVAPSNTVESMISVVIPVRNEEKHIGSVLEQLVQQAYPAERFEILVCDGGSTDATRQVVQRIASDSPVRIVVIDNPERLSSAGRNVGAKNAQGDIVLFIDGHCRIPNTQLLSNTARLMQETGADCLCRPQPLVLANTTFQRSVAAVRATWIAHGRDSLIFDTSYSGFVDPTSSGACYRREVFDKIGYYDERFDACEDVEFNHRVKAAGLRAYTDPSLTIEYEPRSTLGQLFQQTQRYGRGRFRLVRKHRSAFSVSQLLPALLLAGIGGGAMLAYWSGPLRLAYFGVLALYLALVIGSSLPLLRNGIRIAALAPLVIVTVHLGFGVGYLRELFSQIGRRWKQPVHMVETGKPERSSSSESRARDRSAGAKA